MQFWRRVSFLQNFANFTFGKSCKNLTSIGEMIIRKTSCKTFIWSCVSRLLLCRASNHRDDLLTAAGDFDTYIRTRGELEENQMKKFKWEQEQISHMKEYIARFGHGSAKLARQAQSKEKTLEKMVRSGLTEKVQTDSVIKIAFTDVPKLPPPVLQFAEVTFGYSTRHILYTKVGPASLGPIPFPPSYILPAILIWLFR